MNDFSKSARSTTPVVFFLSMIVLAAVVHLSQAVPAEEKLAAKRHQRETLQQRIAREREISEEYAVRRRCLETDPQTIEAELRSRGFARPEDRNFEPIGEVGDYR